MDVYISVGLEGVAGVVDLAQVDDVGAGRAYRRACGLMTGEANAAVGGAITAGAQRIIVNDAHGRMNNLDLETLDPRVECSVGYPKPFASMAGITSRFGACCLIGYHAGAGSAPAILDHTLSRRMFRAVRLNGVRQTETTLNAGLAGHHGVPVVMVSGDEATCAEAIAVLGPKLQTVATKAAFGSGAAYCLHPSVARERIENAVHEGLTRAIGGDVEPYRVTPPYLLECDTTTTLAADYASTIPGVERTAGRTLRFAADDYATVFRALLTMSMLGELIG
ncbi:MAG TPA: M55 family metallopeptidase [Candidatus Dormibacteraeota bacterium]|jgi:D-amino peptidase